MWWWRKVRNHTYWRPGTDLHPERLSYYVHDVALRPNEEGLSLYAVTDDSEANKVAHYYGLTQMGYDHLDFLLIPDVAWDAFGFRPELVPCSNIPDYLSTRHHEVRGLTETRQVQLAEIILRDTNRKACRSRKGELLGVALTYLNAEPALRQFLHEEWEAKLFPC